MVRGLEEITLINSSSEGYSISNMEIMDVPSPMTTIILSLMSMSAMGALITFLMMIMIVAERASTTTTEPSTKPTSITSSK